MKYYYEDNLGKLYETNKKINTLCNVTLALKQVYTSYVNNINNINIIVMVNSNTLTQVNIYNYYYKYIYNSSACDKCRSGPNYCLWAGGKTCTKTPKDACMGTKGAEPEGTWCGPTPPPPPTPPPTPPPPCSSYNDQESCCKNACNICPSKSIDKLFTTSDCSNGVCPTPGPGPSPPGDSRICIWDGKQCNNDANPCPKGKPLPTNIKGFYQRFNWTVPPSMHPTQDPPKGCNLVVLFTGGEPGANLYRDKADDSQLKSYTCYNDIYPVLPTATWDKGSAIIPVISDLAKGGQCGGCNLEEAQKHVKDKHYGGAGGPPENYADDILYFLCFSGGEPAAAIRTIDLQELTTNILPRIISDDNKYHGICFDWEGFNSSSGLKTTDKDGKPCPKELMQDNIDLVISTLKSVKQHGLLVMITTSGNAGTGQYMPGDPGNNIVKSIMDPTLVDIYSPQIYQQTNSSTLNTPFSWRDNGGIEIKAWADAGIRVVPSIIGGVKGDVSKFESDNDAMGSKANDYIIW